MCIAMSHQGEFEDTKDDPISFSLLEMIYFAHFTYTCIHITCVDTVTYTNFFITLYISLKKNIYIRKTLKTVSLSIHVTLKYTKCVYSSSNT